MRAIVVGINPSNHKTTDKHCITIKRLFNWMDALNIKYFSFVNCISSPGRYNKSDIEYEFLEECMLDYEVVLALGNFPSEALNKINVKHFKLPHPSGLNRQLNDSRYESTMLDQCRNYIYG